MRLAGILAILCTALPVAGQIYGDRAGGWLMVDFRAYYCASSALVQHRSPYTVESLHDCESRYAPPFYRAPAHVSVPAPYPPYALAVVAPLTFLPFGVATAVWWLVLATSVYVAAWSLAKLTRRPFIVPWACLALSLGLTSIPSGNMLPVGVAALVFAALCAQRGRFTGAAVAITVSMIEPHVALPAAVAAFLCYPQIRALLPLLFALLGAVSFVSGGFAHNVAYFTSVIPAHALSEVSRDNQYSLSTVVAALGVPDVQAVLAGSVSYVIAVVAGILVAMRLARDYCDPALALLVPPAFALLGGSFVHLTELAVAVPACLLLLVRAKAHRRWILVALILVAVPWMMATSAALFLAPLFPVAYLVYVLGRRDRTIALAAGLSSLVAILLLFILAAQPPTHAIANQHVARPFIDPDLAEASWRSFVLANSTDRPVTWLLRLPSWLGLIVLAGTTFALSSRDSLGLGRLPPKRLLQAD